MKEAVDLNLSMFKAYDIRTTEEQLSEPVILRLMGSIARYFKEVAPVKAIVLGRDARLDAPRLLQYAVDMLPLYGFDVILNPLQVSTCQFYFSSMQNRECGAIMFTASHNPGRYIGLKLLSSNMQTLAMGYGEGGGIEAIRDFYIKNEPVLYGPQRGKVIIRRYLDQYIDYSMKLCGLEPGQLQGARILVDALNGAVGTEICEALGLAGAYVVPRNLIPDGRFPVGDPNPIILSSIQPTWDLIKKGGFDFGFAYDGDGDRMDTMSSEGVQLSPSFNMAALGPTLYELYSGISPARPFKPHIYADVKANPLAMVEQAKSGFGVHTIRNGHSFIKTALQGNRESGYIAAAEESAHYYMNFPYDLKDISKGFASTENTLFYTLLTAKTWTADKERYQRMLNLQDTVCRRREWAVSIQDEALMKSVMKEIETTFKEKGLLSFTKMEDNSPLDSTILRYGLPELINPSTNLNGDWYQVACRISKSEDGIGRFEVVGSSKPLVSQASDCIDSITDALVEKGKAKYV